MRKRNLRIWLVMATFLLVFGCTTGLGDVIYIDDDAPNDPCHGNPDCSDPDENGSLEHPFDAIQEAVDIAVDGDTVIVLPGTFTGTGNRDIDFLGKAITVRSSDPNDPNVVAATVIDCEEATCGFYFHNGEGSNSVLDGLTIVNGQANHIVSDWGIEFGVGGGICCYYSSPTVRNCIIAGNRVWQYNALGGGMGAWYGNPTVVNCTFRDNWSYFLGGGMGYIGEQGTVTLVNCVFTGNVAFSPDDMTIGGGVFNFNENGRTTLINCRLSDNSAWTAASWALSFGGGIHNDLGDNVNMVLINCTISGNSADRGAGVSAVRDTSLFNCIVWMNRGTQIEDSVSVTYSNIQGGWAGTGNIDADPCFVNPDSNDYHLLPGSPCIDAGDNNSLPPDLSDFDGDGNTTEPIPWDLDGNPRIVDGNSDGNSVVDMGAYEYFLPPIEVEMKFTPQALNPGSKGNWMKAHFVLPEEFAIEDVDANMPAVVQPGGIESDYMNVFINDDGLVEIEAAFGRAEFCSIVTGGEPMEVTVVGSLTSGRQFYGTDTIKISTNIFEYLAVLASHWLEAECGKPDWCSGADLDQDSLVNFSDFALYDGCCIEVVKE